MAAREIDSRVVASSYDQIAREYHGSRLAKTDASIAFLDGLAQHWPTEGTVLDLGCGGGCPVAKYFYDRGLDVTGVDVSVAMLELARNAMPKGTFIQADMATVELARDSFNLVLSFFAIIHVPRSKHAHLFAKMRGWLRPGGLLFVTLGVEDREAKVVQDWRGQPMYWSHFDADTNIAMLEAAGFELVWSEIDRRSDDDDHLFVLGRRSG